MDRALILDQLRPDYMQSIPVLGGVVLRPAPAVVMATLLAGNEGFQNVFNSPSKILGDEAFLEHLLKDNDEDDEVSLRPTFQKLIASTARDVDPKVRPRLLADRAEAFLVAAVISFQISLPRDTAQFFPTRPAEAKPVFQVEDDPDDMSVQVFRTAFDLSASGFQDAFEMSWIRLSFAARTVSQDGIDTLRQLAVGAKAGQADEKSFQAFLRKLGR